MKSAKWLVLLLVLVGAMLFLLRQKPDSVTSPAPVAEAIDAVDGSASAESKPAATLAVETAPLVAAGTATASATLVDPLEGANQLQVIVLNLNNQPLEGAVIRTGFRGESRRPAHTNLVRTFTTSASGMANVLWPTQKLEQFELAISKDEYGPRKMIWDLKAGDKVPANYTVKLRASFHIGGVVVDPEGNPVAEALVNLYRFWSGSDEIKNQGEEADFPSQKHTTGADGRWIARNLPTELVNNISISAAHTNYIAARVNLNSTPETEAALRAGTYRLQLTRGLVVRGRVINEQQQPIAGATVWSGRKYSGARKETKTDEQGRFTIMNVSTGRVDFTASAEGYAPNYKSQEVGAVTEEVVLQLEKGAFIRGVVQDEAQQPIQGVRVVLEGSPPDASYDRFEFSTTSDSEGKFEWRAAPNKPMPFYFGKAGYQQRRNVILKPEEENIVKLNFTRKLVGQVVDADTGQPVTRFSASVGRSYGENQYYPDSGRAREFKSESGSFTLEVEEDNSNAAQVTADDYADQVQKMPAAENGEFQLLFRMKPSPSLAGIVVTPDGAPVADAKVAVVDENWGGRSVQFRRGKLESQGTRSKLVTTDAEGRFAIPSPPDVGTVVAANGTAFGSASVAEVRAKGIVTLQGFGRIDGMLLRGNTPGAGQDILLTANKAAINFEWETARKVTDAQGLFSFENVPAGTFAIVRLIKISPNSWQHSHSTPVTVKAGETTDIVLGGTDGTVQGQVKFETPPASSDYRVAVTLSPESPPVPEGLSPEERRAYWSSEALKEQMKQRKHYSGMVNADGSLNLDGIAPGQYTLVIRAYKNGEEEYRSSPIATGGTTVMVPDGASPATPISIGDVVLKAAK